MVLRVFRHFVPVSIICLALADLLLVSVAFHLVSTETSFLSTHFSDALQSPSLKLSGMIAVSAMISGLYDSKSFLNYRSMVTQILLSLFFTCVALAIGNFYFVDWSGSADWLWEIQKAALTWLVCILFTRAVFITMADLNPLKRRVLVLGTGTKAARIAALATDSNKPHFIPVAYLDVKALEASAGNTEIDGASQNTVFLQAHAFNVNEIVIATDDRRGLPINNLLRCRREGIKVTDYMDFIERQTNSIDIAALQPGWLVFSDGFRTSRWARFAKRTTDILLSIGLLALTLPLILFTCALIKFDSRGPVLYRQERIGLGGRPFTLLKFRSMRADAEKDGLAQWAKMGDLRITRVGRVIRKFRIDELPQLLNVFRGDMSFVGPRPERPAFVDEFTKRIPFYEERHWVKPGITGWAQIKYQYGASEEDARVKLAYDLYYVKNHGLFLDFIIALQTVRVVLWADGAR